MGSSGQKKRKKTQHQPQQHLPKVGTTPAEHQHQERQAIADTMGLANAPSWMKSGAVLIVALLIIAAIVGLLIINTFF